MSVFGTLQNRFGQYMAKRERTRTVRMINALPPDIRRDIGWPGFYPEGHLGNDGTRHR